MTTFAELSPLAAEMSLLEGDALTPLDIVEEVQCPTEGPLDVDVQLEFPIASLQQRDRIALCTNAEYATLKMISYSLGTRPDLLVNTWLEQEGHKRQIYDTQIWPRSVDSIQLKHLKNPTILTHGVESMRWRFCIYKASGVVFCAELLSNSFATVSHSSLVDVKKRGPRARKGRAKRVKRTQDATDSE
jgi:hypothetical protein